MRTSWDPVADWYNGWVGKRGSDHHRRLAIPAVLELLEPRPGEHILDIGAGQGVLAPFIVRARARYTGLDASSRLLEFARKHHGEQGRFLLADAHRLAELPELHQRFDAAVFLLSLQDMDPLASALTSAAWTLRHGGRLILLMTHPCFRVPWQSGWGWDERRKRAFRRIESYLTPFSVPMQPYPGGNGATRSFHRPLQAYINSLAECGLLVERLREIPADKARAENLDNREIPLFLGLRARKVKT
ncbi:MAG TPA: class I SAM-dependent methyltransferase [Chthonomonadaceae bacterium]|nr:class I SAM-dependent methyltransferase [Chthonomonadaceae bacterium]